MLQIPANKRLAYVKAVLKNANLEFEVAELEAMTGHNKGNISKMLNAKTPVTRNFFTTFQALFPPPPPGWDQEQGMVSLDELKQILLRLEAKLDVLAESDPLSVRDKKEIKKSYQKK